MYHFESELWRYPGDAAWHFVTVPGEVSDDIAASQAGAERRGFGSVRVRVRIGSSAWTTSVFPDKARGAYLLPVKKPVRAAEGLADGQPVDVNLELLEQ